MPQITEAMVKKIARLSNLQLTPDETVQFAGQLEKILEYFHKLSQLDTTHVPETAYALPRQNIWRADQVRPGLKREEVLAAAPDAFEGCFRVPRIME